MSKAASPIFVPAPTAPPAAWKGALGAALVLVLAGPLAGCGAGGETRTTGERLSDRGNAIRANGSAWSDGQRRVQSAEKAIAGSTRDMADGERDLARAREQLAKAEQRISAASARKSAALQDIDEGRAQMSRAEADYTATKAGPSAIRPGS